MSTSHFTPYRADRLAGKFVRSTIGSGRKKGEKAKPVSANTLNHDLAICGLCSMSLNGWGSGKGRILSGRFGR